MPPNESVGSLACMTEAAKYHCAIAVIAHMPEFMKVSWSVGLGYSRTIT